MKGTLSIVLIVILPITTIAGNIPDSVPHMVAVVAIAMKVLRQRMMKKMPVT